MRTALALALTAALTGCSDGMHLPGMPPICSAPDTPDPALADCGAAAGLPEGVSAESETRFTFRCGATDLRVEAVDEGTIRLRYLPRGTSAPERSFAIVPRLDPAPAVRRGHTCDGAAVLCTSTLAVRINPADCRLRATRPGGAVLIDDPEGGGFFDRGDARGVVRLAPPGEHYYGAGEHTGPLDQRGRAVTLWNTDAYVDKFGGYPPDAPLLYQSIPFFIALRDGIATGVFTDAPTRVTLDFAAAAPDRFRLTAEGPIAVDQYLLAGPTFADVLDRYTRLTGRPALPPRWALGYHQSRWGWSPDARVRQIAQTFRDRRLPADGLFLDIQHMDGFRDFTWDPKTFPDPAGLLRDLAALGFKTTVIEDPALKADPAWDLYQSGLAGNHFITDGKGAPYIGEVWPGPAAFPDFTRPQTRAWWGTLVKRDLDVGARGLWLDMNEPSNFKKGDGGTLPSTLPVDGDGVPTTMAEAHNVYALEELRASFEGAVAAVPDRRPFLLTRAGYAGIQRYAAVWTGDAPSTFDTLRATLPMLLNLGLSGVPFVGSDVGGYSGNATPELFARWMQLGAVSPFFRGHVQTGVPDQEPWAFGTEVEDISRSALEWRYRLLPYVYSLMAEAARTGAPPLRPLVWAFPTDEQAATTGDEALLGPALLVAPVLEKGAEKRRVYLPTGRWFESRSGAIWDGPTTIDLNVTLGALPVFVREGGILPRAPLAQHTGAQTLAPLFLDAYPGPVPTAFTLQEDDGESFQYSNNEFARTRFALESTGQGARLTVERTGGWRPPARSMIVTIRRVDHPPTAVTLDGMPLPAISLEAVAAGATGWSWDPADLALVVAVPDRPPFTLESTYDPAIPDPRPRVAMPFQVTVPPGTKTDAPICIASSANGWTHQPLTWDPGMRSASGTMLVPRGEPVFYKYTRGDWRTVEKWPGCVEATNRYELGAAHPLKQDTVWEWADRCP